MLRKILSFLTVIALSIGFIGTTKTVNVKAESADFDCNYSATKDTTTNLGYFGAGEIIHYTEEEAIAAGVPAGFSGDVLKVIGKGTETNMGVLCDFSHLNIPISVIKSITFRVYVANDADTADKYPEIRIPKPYYNGDWTMRYYDIKDHIAEWHDVVYTGSLDSISKNGYLDKFEVALRHQNITDFYIDSIKVNYIANDGVAPIITYNGEDHVSIAQGQNLQFNVSARDELEGNIEVELVWGDPSRLDENGNPLCGEHTLTFTATDFFGNVAEHSITVTVTEPDLLAPEMTIPTTEIYVKTGTTPLINVKATDNKDGEIEIVREWSKNALDKTGKLTEGTHTLTLTASDLSGNTTVKVITFYVSANGDSEENIVDEEILCPKESEPESESESESIAQTESAKESESIKQSESEKVSASESKKESESIKQSESEKVSVSESKKDSESIKQSESKKESESKKTSESKKESNKQSSKDSSKDSQSSSAVSSGCVGAISIIPFISLLTLAGAISLIKKKK